MNRARAGIDGFWLVCLSWWFLLGGSVTGQGDKEQRHKREVALSSSNTFLNSDENNFEKKLVLYYNFDNSDDIIQNKAYDSSKFDNHGTFRSGALTINIPKSTCKNAAYLFCSDIRIEGNTFQAKPTYGITVAAWIILLEKRGPRSIFEIFGEKTAHPSYHLEINANLLYWYHRNPETNKQVFSVVAEGIVTKRWTHVAATYNQTTGIGQLFINGVVTNRTVGRGSLSKDWSSLVHIGNSECREHFGGFLDDFRIYNYALRSHEVVDVMKNCSFAEKGPEPEVRPDIINVPSIEKRNTIANTTITPKTTVKTSTTAIPVSNHSSIVKENTTYSTTTPSRNPKR